MIVYEIPGRESIYIENIVFDYNGTIAIDGKLIKDLIPLIEEVSKLLNVYILTADTYGTVEKECENIKGQVVTFPRENAGEFKKEIVKRLGSDKTICIGNGYNDIPMFEEAALSIGVMEGEGMSGKLLSLADIVVSNIIDGINIVLNKDRVRATLRN